MEPRPIAVMHFFTFYLASIHIPFFFVLSSFLSTTPSCFHWTDAGALSVGLVWPGGSAELLSMGLVRVRLLLALYNLVVAARRHDQLCNRTSLYTPPRERHGEMENVMDILGELRSIRLQCFCPRVLVIKKV